MKQTMGYKSGQRQGRIHETIKLTTHWRKTTQARCYSRRQLPVRAGLSISVKLAHMQGAHKSRVCLYARNIKKCMGILNSLNIVNWYRVMSVLKLKTDVNLSRLLCIWSFLRLKMASLGDLVGSALTVTTSVGTNFRICLESIWYLFNWHCFYLIHTHATFIHF